MTDDQIAKKVVSDLGGIGAETVKETVSQAGKITESIITGQELLGVKPISEEDLANKKTEDEKKVKEETKRILGRDVEGEIKKVREEKTEAEKKEEQMLLDIKKQREAEETERRQLLLVPGNAKKEAAKTQFAPGKRNKQQPDPAQMSQTSEFKGGKID
jgi:hypothetical protein